MDHVTTAALEVLCTVAGTTLFGEATVCQVTRTGGLPDLQFTGLYRGVPLPDRELKNYDVTRGQLREVTPKDRYGAVELALRQSVLDLNDGVVRGGRQSGTTLGLNWYYGRQIRIAVNYSMIRVETRTAVERPRLLQIRFQFDY